MRVRACGVHCYLLRRPAPDTSHKNGPGQRAGSAGFSPQVVVCLRVNRRVGSQSWFRSNPGALIIHPLREVRELAMALGACSHEH